MARAGYPSDKQAQFMVRLPDGMRDRLKEAAADNNRSMNAEIVARLRDTLKSTRQEKYLAKQMEELALRTGSMQAVAEDLAEWRRDVWQAVEELLALAGEKVTDALVDHLNRLRAHRPGYDDPWLTLAPAIQQKNPEVLRALGQGDIAGAVIIARAATEESEKVVPKKTDLERDVLAIIEAIEAELESEEAQAPIIRTDLGEKLGDAVGQRTEAAMRKVVEELQKAGLLEESRRVETSLMQPSLLVRRGGHQ
jgi:plasmid stability protein